MKVEIGGIMHEAVAGCFVIAEDNGCDKKVGCRLSDKCIWAEVGRRGSHLVDKIPDKRSVG